MGVIRKSRDGNVVLIYRGDSPNVFCRIKRPDASGWIQKSTGTTDVDKALLKAEEWHDEVRFKAKHGLALETKSFSSVCDLYLKELKSEVTLGIRNERHLKDYTPTISRYLIPFFGNKDIATISNQDIAAYQKWRMAYWISGPGSDEKFIEYVRNGKRIRRPAQKRKAPSQSALISENVVLRGIFKTALKNDFIKESQVPTITTKANGGKKTERRPAFSLPEYRKLMTFLREWGLSNDSKVDISRRVLLRDYVRFLVHSGIRPGTETDNLTWGRVKNIKTANGNFLLKVTISGKTGVREPILDKCSGQSVAAILRRWRFTNITDRKKQGRGHPPSDLPVFSLADGTPVKNDYFRAAFGKVLKMADLEYDDLGQKRSLYSLRHTYATFQLLYRKVSIYKLAVQMGTSVKMIEQHYGHLTPELAADELTNGSFDEHD